MNGAQSVVRTLVDGGVEICFANPGTSEIHLAAELEAAPGIRGVLALFEGVVTGAADGYGRMARKPAATLLHLGPGLGNGLANLHNARRARTPVVNLVGEHATYHKRHDAPLESDIAAVASNVSGWTRAAGRLARIAEDAAEAIAAAHGPPGQVATLVLPADLCWQDGARPARARARPARAAVAEAVVDATARLLLSGEPCTLLVGGVATREPALTAAMRVAGATGAKLLCEPLPARLERGAGRPPIRRLAYFPEVAAAQLADTRHLVLVDAAAPVSFFAYPGQPSLLAPDGCRPHVLAAGADDAVGSLRALAEAVDAGPSAAGQAPERPEQPAGKLTAKTAAAAIGALLPEGAIVCDEANTAGAWLETLTAGAPPHDWLTLTGGAIGHGLPLATGAALACPDRKVLCLGADGSAMYTLQALWTQAREGLDVTTVILNNRAYALLDLELSRAGLASPEAQTPDLFDLSRPDLDFVALAGGMGVQASRADSAEELVAQLDRALAAPGPALVEAMVEPPRRRAAGS